MEAVEINIIPIKCALKFSPPLLILVYRDDSTGKLRRRSMPLRGFTANTNISSYAKELQLNRNKVYVKAIPETQLHSLLQRLKHAQGEKLDNGKNSSIDQSDSIMEPGEKSNHDTKVQSENGSNLTQKDTATNIINSLQGSKLPPLGTSKKGNPFKSTDSLLNASNTPFSATESWNDPVDKSTKSFSKSAEISDYSAEFYSESEKAGNPDKSSKLSKDNDGGDDSNSLSFAPEELEDEEADNYEFDFGGDEKEMLGGVTETPEEDLNKVSDDVLSKKKKEMDILFEANRIKPGDDGYEYDKEVDFCSGPKTLSGWDSD